MRIPDPIPALKQQLGAELAGIVEGWNVHDIAYLLEVDRARVSNLRRGKLDRFSLDMLVRLLARRGYAVELRVVPPAIRRSS